MTISTIDGLVAAAKQRIVISHLTNRTSVAASMESQFDIAGGNFDHNRRGAY